jgi:dodecin
MSVTPVLVVGTHRVGKYQSPRRTHDRTRNLLEHDPILPMPGPQRDRLAERLRDAAPPDRRGGRRMSDSVYRVTDVIGTSSESWEAAARNAVATAAGTVRDLRIAEVVRQDVTIENGAVTGFRVRLSLSFKYEANE